MSEYQTECIISEQTHHVKAILYINLCNDTQFMSNESINWRLKSELLLLRHCELFQNAVESWNGERLVRFLLIWLCMLKRIT